MSSAVRVRFAPSPTGYLHVGGARTALFNWLYARHTGGAFVLRIEDTDKARNTDEAVRVILDGLRWLGMDWDEGPEVGGERGPYFQSQREEVYLKYFERLRDGGHLYEDNGAWRFRSLRKVVTVPDAICGTIDFDLSHAETHPDMTIRRPDGSWIFHFVNVVDDIEMGITHVIRGEDHLSNTPKHLELFEALGAKPPQYGHIPLILNRDGTKMSKRDKGASVTGYMEEGYAPEAVVNYLSLLGWSPKDGREKLEREEVVRLFDLGSVNRKNAQFDLDKCVWLNGQYLQLMPVGRYLELARPFLRGAGVEWADDGRMEVALGLVREKVKLLSELPVWVAYFFSEQFSVDEDAVTRVLGKEGAGARLRALVGAFSGLESWDGASIEAAVQAVAAAGGAKIVDYVQPVRVAVSGRMAGPNLYPMLEFLGREAVVGRLTRSADRLG
jgi:glutamyl-tRNA synthetase